MPTSTSGRPLKVIARIHTDAVRGLDGFSHLWLLWEFSEVAKDRWSPLVRPPRLGGTKKVGVFATRSPYRPNALGLSSVALSKVRLDPRLGPVVTVLGADLLDNTPIYDIKPYLAYTDSHADACGGFTDTTAYPRLTVEDPSSLSGDMRN